MLPQQQLQNAFPLNKQQAAPTKAQQKLCPFCNKTYSLMKIFNYKSSEKSKYKRYYHTHSNCCTNPKGSNYCYDSNGIPGKKYCSNACLTRDSVDSKMEARNGAHHEFNTIGTEKIRSGEQSTGQNNE